MSTSHEPQTHGFRDQDTTLTNIEQWSNDPATTSPRKKPDRALYLPKRHGANSESKTSSNDSSVTPQPVISNQGQSHKQNQKGSRRPAKYNDDVFTSNKSSNEPRPQKSDQAMPHPKYPSASSDTSSKTKEPVQPKPPPKHDKPKQFNESDSHHKPSGSQSHTSLKSHSSNNDYQQSKSRNGRNNNSGYRNDSHNEESGYGYKSQSHQSNQRPTRGFSAKNGRDEHGETNSKSISGQSSVARSDVSGDQKGRSSKKSSQRKKKFGKENEFDPGNKSQTNRRSFNDKKPERTHTVDKPETPDNVATPIEEKKSSTTKPPEVIDWADIVEQEEKAHPAPTPLPNPHNMSSSGSQKKGLIVLPQQALSSSTSTSHQPSTPQQYQGNQFSQSHNYEERRSYQNQRNRYSNHQQQGNYHQQQHHPQYNQQDNNNTRFNKSYPNQAYQNKQQQPIQANYNLQRARQLSGDSQPGKGRFDSLSSSSSYHGYNSPHHGNAGGHQRHPGHNPKQPDARLQTLFSEANEIAHNMQQDFNTSNFEFSRLVPYIETMRDLFTRYIFENTASAVSNNVESIMWRCLFYQVFDNLRRWMQMKEHERYQDLIQKVQIALVRHTIDFYTQLVAKVGQEFGIDVDSPATLPETDKLGHIKDPDYRRHLRNGLLLCQRFWIALGDLNRYDTLFLQEVDQDFSTSRNFYLRAAKVWCEFGHVYNLLGVLATYTKRHLEACFFFCRAIALPSNASDDVQEKLKSLLGEATRLAHIEHTREAQLLQEQRKQTNELESDNSIRLEIWVAHDRSETKMDCANVLGQTSDYATTASMMPLSELAHKFVNNYLASIGKLITRISFESYPETSSCSLHEFAALLRHPARPLTTEKIIHVACLAIYAATKAHSPSLGVNKRSHTELAATQLVLDLFGLLLARCVDVFEVKNNSPSPDLATLLPGIKVFCDWLLFYPNFWNPPPYAADPQLGPNVDAWAQVARLGTLIHLSGCGDFAINHISYVKRPGLVSITLNEHILLNGFTPLIKAQERQLFFLPNDDVPSLDCQFLARIRRFLDFADFLTHENILEFDTSTSKYSALVSTCTVSEKVVAAATTNPMSAGEGGEESGDEADLLKQQISLLLGDLVALKMDAKEERKLGGANLVHMEVRILESEKRLNQLRSRLRAIEGPSPTTLASNRSVPTVRMIVTPIVLVIDTNCLIDFLALIRKILASNQYTVVVPLVVINELEGLCKPGDDGDRELTRNAALQARDYLESQFSNKNPKLKSMAAEGTILTSIQFKNEIYPGMPSSTRAPLNNDEVILGCCSHYCNDSLETFKPDRITGVISLTRTVVLLTADRNLRLKAYLKHMPACSLPGFTKWAKI